MTTFIKSAQSLVRKGDLFIAKNGEKNFHREAAHLLQAASMADQFDFKKLAEAAFAKKLNQIQYFKFHEFSDLPITVARGKHCFIDVYFWRRRPTVIHNHHFMGAFQCLQGINVDLEFHYKELHKLGKYHGLGVISEFQTRTLKPGDVAEINYLNKFIHQNHHQTDLTVNLCFRTAEGKQTNISNFLFSGLRYEKSHLLVERVERLIKFCRIGEFKVQDLDLNIDDAIYFLIQTFGTTSENKQLLSVRKFLDKKLKSELKLDLDSLLTKHEAIYSEHVERSFQH